MLRPARRSDHRRLEALEGACFQHDLLSARSMMRLLDRPSAAVTVDEDDAGPALRGYVMTLFREGSRVGRIYSLAVSPDHRRRGVASRLIATAEAVARDRGRSVLRAELRAENQASMAAFTRAGFAVRATTTGYYEDGADAIRLQKLLAP